jgi:flagellar biosynthesis protein FliR
MLLGTPIKTLLGLTLLYFALKYWPEMLEHLFLQSMKLSDQLLVEAH